MHNCTPLLQVHQTFEKWTKTLPAGKLLPCLSQAVSSLAHPYPHTKQQIQNFVAGVTIKYPYRSLWLLRAVMMSENKGRRASADAVMCLVQKDASEDLKKLIKSHGDVCQGIEVRVPEGVNVNLLKLACERA
jgi:hypothetical protein